MRIILAVFVGYLASRIKSCGGAGVQSMSPKFRLVDVTNKYIGAPYKLGGKSKREGFDCFGLSLYFARDELGVEFPQETYEGYTLDSYPEIWENDPSKAKRFMIGVFNLLAKRIPAEKAFVTDLLLMERGEDEYVGIHAGNGLVLTSFTNLGVQLANLNGFKVKGAYRWVVEDNGMR